MARLYYEKEPSSRLQSGSDSSINNTKDYLEKVSKIIPSEVIAGYLALIGFVPLIKNQNLHEGFYYGIFFLGILLSPIYLNSQADKGKPKIIHLFLSSLSFIFWAYSTTGDKIFPNFFDSAIASILLISFSLISGKIPLN